MAINETLSELAPQPVPSISAPGTAGKELIKTAPDSEQTVIETPAPVTPSSNTVTPIDKPTTDEAATNQQTDDSRLRDLGRSVKENLTRTPPPPSLKWWEKLKGKIKGSPKDKPVQPKNL